jgi:hypothetical protein
MSYFQQKQLVTDSISRYGLEAPKEKEYMNRNIAK